MCQARSHSGHIAVVQRRTDGDLRLTCDTKVIRLGLQANPQVDDLVQ